MKNKIGQILRWIFVIPLAVVISIIARFCFSWTYQFVFSYFVDDYEPFVIDNGPLIFRLLFIFISEGFAVGFGIYSGVYLAPSRKRSTFISFIVLWVLIQLFIAFSIGLSFHEIGWTIDELLRSLMRILGQLVGLIMAGIYVSKDMKRDAPNTHTLNNHSTKLLN